MDHLFCVLRYIQSLLEFSDFKQTMYFMVPFTLVMLNPQHFLTIYMPLLLIFFIQYQQSRPSKKYSIPSLINDQIYEHENENIALLIKWTRYMKMMPELINENVFWHNEKCTQNFRYNCMKYGFISTAILFFIDLKYIILVSTWVYVLSHSPIITLLTQHVLFEKTPKFAASIFKLFLFVLDLILPRIIGVKRSRTII